MTWVEEARARPVAFAVVREDPLLDRAVLETVTSPARVVMVASGGCTAAYLATLPGIASLTVVDPNPAQLALTGVKLAALTLAPRARARSFGHDWHHWSASLTDDDRDDIVHERCRAAGVDLALLGSQASLVAYGFDRIGRYEAVFAELRHTLARLGKNDAIHRMHAAADVAHQRDAMIATRFEPALREACEQAFELSALKALFGDAATANARVSFSEHFAERIADALTRFPLAKNVWLKSLLCDGFPQGADDHPWMSAPALAAAPRVNVANMTMQDVLSMLPAASVDFLHLSNILDWLSEGDAFHLLSDAARVLAPGGALLVRQLNSLLTIPSLSKTLAWDERLSAELLARDRSFFYRAIHVGRSRA